MKTTKIITAVSILAGLLVLGGQAVRFTASAQPSTKTSYSGSGTITNGFLEWERIDWVESDKIRVASNYAYMQDPGDGGLTQGIHYADYSVGTPVIKTGDPTRSVATMMPYNQGSNGLVWDDEESTGYEFYAVYPCPYATPAEKEYISLDSGPQDGGTTLGEVTATLPATQTLITEGTKTLNVDANGAIVETAQPGGFTYTVYPPDMEYAFMSAATTGIAANTDGVTLVFNPAYTAFEFFITTKDDLDELTLNSISLIAADTGTDVLSGEYSFAAGADFNGSSTPAVNVAGTDKTVSMTFGSGLAITPGEGIAVTLFTIPKTNTGTLTLKLETNLGTASLLLLNGEDPYQFAAGKKHRINLLRVKGKWVLKAQTMNYGGYNDIEFTQL